MLVFMGFVDNLDKEKYRLSESTKVGGNTSVDICSLLLQEKRLEFLFDQKKRDQKKLLCFFCVFFLGGVKCVK